MPTKSEKDVFGAQETTGHEWDGIEELDTPLPRWWVYAFYVTIAWAVVYWVLFPAWPSLSGYTRGLLGYSQYEDLAGDVAAARARQGGFLARMAEASVEEISGDKELLDFSLAGGRVQFAENCAACHGVGGAGVRGYPSLADDDWLWGGTLANIAQTIHFGVRAAHDETRQSEMPRFGLDELLSVAEIEDTADFVLSLSGVEADAAAVARGAAVFADNCAACHGDGGEGNAELGAPRLNDAIWLYGGDRKTVIATISKARGGVMPAWIGRLDETTLKMLTVYVHSLGGGQ